MGFETLALGMMVAGAGMSAYSSYQQGRQAREAGKVNAQIERNNQKSLQAQTDIEIQRTREKYRRTRGAQIAAGVASGLDIGGSFGDLLQESNMQEDIDILSTMYRAKNEMVGMENKAKFAVAEGKNAWRSGVWGAAGSLISGAGAVSAQQAQFNSYKNYPSLET